jgi:hypothetical protein
MGRKVVKLKTAVTRRTTTPNRRPKLGSRRFIWPSVEEGDPGVGAIDLSPVGA